MSSIIFIDGENFRHRIKEVFEKFGKEEPDWSTYDYAGLLSGVLNGNQKNHERRYLGLLKNVEDGTVFKKKESVRWRCRNCGYVHDGSEPPNACPACAHAQSYFELLGENW